MGLINEKPLMRRVGGRGGGLEFKYVSRILDSDDAVESLGDLKNLHAEDVAENYVVLYYEESYGSLKLVLEVWR